MSRVTSESSCPAFRSVASSYASFTTRADSITRVVGTNDRPDGRWHYLDEGLYGAFSNIPAEDVHALVFAAAELGVQPLGDDAAERATRRILTRTRVPVTLAEGSDLLHGELTIYYCEAVQESLCFIDQIGIDVPVTVSADGSEPRIAVERVVEPPVVPEESF